MQIDLAAASRTSVGLAAFLLGVLVGIGWTNYADHVEHWGGVGGHDYDPSTARATTQWGAPK